MTLPEDHRNRRNDQGQDEGKKQRAGYTVALQQYGIRRRSQCREKKCRRQQYSCFAGVLLRIKQHKRKYGLHDRIQSVYGPIAQNEKGCSHRSNAACKAGQKTEGKQDTGYKVQAYRGDSCT